MHNHKKILQIFTKQISDKLEGSVKKILLFGSRARGDYSSDSDYDLLIILDRVTPEVKQIINQISADILFNYNQVISAFPYSYQEFRKRKYEPFIINARKEGVSL